MLSFFSELQSLIKGAINVTGPILPRPGAGRGGEATPTFRSAVWGWCVYE